MAFGLFPVSGCEGTAQLATFFMGERGGGAMREKRSRIHDGIFFILRDGHSEALGETSTVVKSLCLLSQVFIGVIRSKTAELIMADVISGEAVGREEGLKLVSFSVSRGRWGPQETSRW